MRAVWRVILVIPVAFIAASLAAALVIVLGVGADPYATSTADLVGKMIFVSVITSMFVGAIAGVPALIMIILAEAFGWRSLILHLVIGAGIGFVAFLLSVRGDPPATREELQLGAAAGAVAGFVYWLIAGRRAGMRKPPPRAPDTQT